MCVLIHRTYQCRKCGKKFSRMVGDVITSSDELCPTCPKCGSRDCQPVKPPATLTDRIKDYILRVILSSSVIH
jgi:predicted  nucleic acid-binding Zn-ribbon protein